MPVADACVTDKSETLFVEAKSVQAEPCHDCEHVRPQSHLKVEQRDLLQTNGHGFSGDLELLK